MDYWIDTDRFYKPIESDSFPLIHMTKDWEILKFILKEGLRPSYCLESISNMTVYKSACFPMISTSNVSIDYAISYQRSYGTFGIALDKEWGEVNDFNPVLYLERRSSLTNEIIDNFQNITAKSIVDIESALKGFTIDCKSLLTKLLVKLFAHSKNYDGELIRNKVLVAQKYPFGMEREWRKVISQDDIQYFLTGNDIENKNEFNALLKNIRIDYKIQQLRGIIVEDYWQVEEVKEIITKKFGLKEFPNRIDVRINAMRHVPDE